MSILYPITGQVQCPGRVLYCQGEARRRLCVYPLSYCRAGVVYWTCPLLPRRGQEEAMSTSIITKIDPWPGRQDNTTFMTFDIIAIYMI